MLKSQAVTQVVPFLRRYARALTGSQTSGDAYVTATLEALLADRSVLDEQAGARVALFRLFTKIWGSLAINGAARPEVPLRPGEQKLGNLMPLPRQAFLLVALEGFGETDAARILDVDVATLRRLIEESGRELAAQIATDVLIIEDEPFIAMEIEGIIESLGHRVIGVASTHGEAIALMKDKKPGLILSDIQLADGSSGLDAVNELLRSFEVPVVFITAGRAGRHSALDAWNRAIGCTLTRGHPGGSAVRMVPMHLRSTFRLSVVGAASAALCFAAALAIPASIAGPKPHAGAGPRTFDTGVHHTVNRDSKGDRLRVIIRPPDAAPFEGRAPAGSSPKSLDGCESAFGQMDHSPAAKLAQRCVT